VNRFLHFRPRVAFASMVTRTTIRIARASQTMAWVAASLLAMTGLATEVAHAQMMDGSPRAMAWAVPEADRPDELKGARDVLSVNGQPLRLRVQTWIDAVRCPGKASDRAACPAGGIAGRVFVGPLWGDDVPLPQYEIEQLWLLRAGARWNTTVLRQTADHQFEFSAGPAWPTMEPIDVIVKLRGVDGLLQLPYRTAYLRAP
jgi:hypothetical protein